MQTPSIDWQGKMLGRYRLRSLLGRGGMGEVWLADDTQLRRQVAIKLLPAVYAEDRSYLSAFMQEARTAASLEHPHILPVHDFGEEKVEGDAVVTYLVMPHISGGSLRERLRSIQGTFPVNEGLRYLRQAAQAIDYAHSQKVLHRDIKPANMLLQQDWLLLADFGIAKILNDSLRSRTHSGAGTPEYMAPEQAQGRAIPSSDLYSLVIIAYQMLTGDVPFRGKTPYDTLTAQITTPPEPPRKRQPAISPEVEEIILRGLAKQPEQRQPSCLIFVNELEHAIQSNQELATKAATITPTPPEKLSTTSASDPDATVLASWSRRHRRLEPITLEPLQKPGVQPLSPAAQGASAPALPQTQPSSPMLPPIQSGSSISASSFSQPISGGFSQPISGGPYPQAFSGPTTRPSAPNLPPLNPNQPTGQGQAPFAPTVPPIQGNGANLPTYTPSMGAQPYPTYPAPGPTPMPPYANNTIQPSFAGPQGYPPYTASATAPGAFAASPAATASSEKKMGRRRLLISGAAGLAVVAAGGITLAAVTHRASSPGTGTSGAATPPPGPQQLIKGVPLLVLSAHNDGVTSAIWDPKGRYLASAGSDGNVMLWDITSLLKRSATLQTITTPTKKWKFADQIYRGSMSWSMDGSQLAVVVANDHNKITLIQPLTNKPLQAFQRPTADMFDDSSFEDIAWSPKANVLAGSIFFQGDITLFDLRHPNSVMSLLKSNDLDSQNKPYDTTVPIWSLDGRYIAGQTADFKVLVWDTKTGKILQTLTMPSRTTKDFVIANNIQQWSPQTAQRIAVVNLDAVQVWDAIHNKLLLTLGTNDPGPLTIPPNAPDGWVPHMSGMSWSPNGRYIAGGYARSNLVYVWDTTKPVASTAKDGLHVQNLYFGSNGHSLAISNLSWSPDGRYIATASADKTVIIWKVDAK